MHTYLIRSLSFSTSSLYTRLSYVFLKHLFISFSHFSVGIFLFAKINSISQQFATFDTIKQNVDESLVFGKILLYALCGKLLPKEWMHIFSKMITMDLLWSFFNFLGPRKNGFIECSECVKLIDQSGFEGSVGLQ